MNLIYKTLWGILFIIVGVILGLNAFSITNIDIFFDGWWTLFIIVPSVIGLFEPKEEKIENVIGLVIGSVLLLACQGILHFDILVKLIVPFVFVVVGVSFLFGDRMKGKVKEKIKNVNLNELENVVAIFSEQKLVKDNENFKGVKLDSVFGSVIFDLRKADIEKDSIIKASAIFGGIDILLPDDVSVKVNATPIFGGVSNQIRNHSENKKTIYIDAFCMFGGIDIK